MRKASTWAIDILINTIWLCRILSDMGSPTHALNSEK